MIVYKVYNFHKVTNFTMFTISAIFAGFIYPRAKVRIHPPIHAYSNFNTEGMLKCLFYLRIQKFGDKGCSRNTLISTRHIQRRVLGRVGSSLM